MDKLKIELTLDQLNVVWRNPLGLGITATIGRQDICLGSGVLIRDGTPSDGGRTRFFDAARLTYDWPERETTIDLIYVENHGDSAAWLKPINDQDVDLAEQDERGAILYLSDRSRGRTQIDAYFIFKNDHNRNRASGSEGK